MSNQDNVRESWPSGADVDLAMDSAFYEAVRRHRAANEPMVMWEDGESRHVSPFEIPLPGEDLPRIQQLREISPAADSPKRRVSGGD